MWCVATGTGPGITRIASCPPRLATRGSTFLAAVPSASASASVAQRCGPAASAVSVPASSQQSSPVKSLPSSSPSCPTDRPTDRIQPQSLPSRRQPPPTQPEKNCAATPASTCSGIPSPRPFLCTRAALRCSLQSVIAVASAAFLPSPYVALRRSTPLAPANRATRPPPHILMAP